MFNKKMSVEQALGDVFRQSIKVQCFFYFSDQNAFANPNLLLRNRRAFDPVSRCIFKFFLSVSPFLRARLNYFYLLANKKFMHSFYKWNACNFIIYQLVYAILHYTSFYIELTWGLLKAPLKKSILNIDSFSPYHFNTILVA